MSPSALEQRASEVRALARALEVRCADPLHADALAGTPCYPPSSEHPDGWVCIARFKRDIDTRGERGDEAAQRQRDHGYVAFIRRQQKRDDQTTTNTAKEQP